ncbi:MAG: SUMF1/EgtB/PvdO family nonheme iron enzyme [Anaerolineae bacterium]|nr:SUMF1/EgtB/PvdO family nonheme iron enzyme [Anaerolineae bacterium]
MGDYKNEYTGSHLLAIGINNYADPNFFPLGDAEKDAKALAEVLGGEPYGFSVTMLLGRAATKSAILTALSGLRSTKPDDRVIFYFAGHGYRLTDEFEHEVGYLGCSDTNPLDPYEGLEFEEVIKIRRWVKAKHIAFILDACFSGKSLGLTRAAVPQATAEEYMQRRSWQVLTAGGDEVVSDAQSMTGVLVQALSKGIPDESGPLTLSHVGQYVRDTVAARQKRLQIPVCQYLEGSSNGDMVLFIPPEVRAIDLLPRRLSRALTNEDAEIRYLAIAEAERLLADSSLADIVQKVLDDLLVNDDDREVRRRAKEALHVTVLSPAPPRVEAVPKHEPSPVPSASKQQTGLLLDASDILAILPRPFEWCEIPAGQVALEGSAGTFEVQPLWMAMYPITYAQFQVFVDAEDGFRNPRWWEELAADADHKKNPGNQYQKVDIHPRETVSWWDAIAFCQWLNARLGLPPIPADLTTQTLAGYLGIRLPAEWEWQWAAQGPDGREYPYGNTFDPNKSNTGELGIGKTTPVGTFSEGASPYGVLDMSGNVWEWCLNEYNPASLTRLTGGSARVVRGGAWYYGQYDARCSSRDRYNPDGRLDFSGFRVCVS